jgi:thiamine transporter ThiT
LWSLGFVTSTPRVLIHSVAGCAFYGAYAAKMLGLRVGGLPSRTLPILGGLVFALFIVLWSTSAVWFFTRSSLPVF